MFASGRLVESNCLSRKEEQTVWNCLSFDNRAASTFSSFKLRSKTVLLAGFCSSWSSRVSDLLARCGRLMHVLYYTASQYCISKFFLPEVTTSSVEIYGLGIKTGLMVYTSIIHSLSFIFHSFLSRTTRSPTLICHTFSKTYPESWSLCCLLSYTSFIVLFMAFECQCEFIIVGMIE